MKTRYLKRAGLYVSEIGFGCMSLGSDFALNERLIHKAIDHGITYFDTADLYQKGENERVLGRAIKGRREGLVVATKVGNKWSDTNDGWEWMPRKSYILSAAEESLKRLGIEQIDLYQLHGGTIDDPFDEVIEAFEILRSAGKIKSYGLSSIRPNVFMKLVKETGIASNMMQYSLLDRRPEEYFDSFTKYEVGMMARGCLAKGILVNKGISKYLGYTTQLLELMIDKLKSFSIEKKDHVMLALGWVLGHKAITSAIVGISNLEQLDELIDYSKYPELPAEVFEALSTVLDPLSYEQHLLSEQ